MQIIRPIVATDFAALQQIAEESGHGFTSLPQNDEVLAEKISAADVSFNKVVSSPDQEKYLFVLEDSKTNTIVGTTGINASVGIATPIYHYRRSSTNHYSTKLGVTNRIDALHMCNDYTGASEICTLFLREAYRQGYAGKFLSRVRFLFMAEHPQRFSDTVIAEMRGVSCEQGESPFWQWLRTHFVDVDFPTIDYLVGSGNIGFIPQVMPKFPIITSLLSNDARSVIGEVHEKTKPALKMLEKEGFKHHGYVDLFDAGPTIESKLSNIRTVRQSRVRDIQIQPTEGEAMYAVCNGEVADFRATYTRNVHHDKHNNCLIIDPEVAAALKVTSGESVRFVRL